MKRIFQSLGVLAFALTCFAADASWEAEITELKPQAQGYGLPPYLVTVTFPEEGFPVDQVHELSHYKLSPRLSPDQTIVIRAAKGQSGVGGTNDVATNFRAVELVPDKTLSPTIEYTLEVNFGHISSGVLSVKPLAKTPSNPKPSDSQIQRIVDLFKTDGPLKIAATVDLRGLLNGAKTAAIDYNVGFDLFPHWQADKNGTGGTLQKFQFSSEGTLKLNGSDTNVNDHLQLSGNYTFMRDYFLPNFIAQSGDLAYFYGVRLNGFEFESDQNFKVINYTLKPEVAAWVPYSNIPGLWWSQLIGIDGNMAAPAFVYFGYSHVDPINEDPTLVPTSTQQSDRLEAELAYALPLTTQLRAGFRGRWFRLLNEGGTKRYVEIFGEYYLDGTKTKAVIVKYTHGEVPPTFEKGAATSVGISLSF